MNKWIKPILAGIFTGAIMFAAVAAPIPNGKKPGQVAPTKPTKSVSMEVIGIIESKTNPNMLVLLVVACGQNVGFEFPKSMLYDDEAMEQFLETTVLDKVEQICNN